MIPEFTEVESGKRDDRPELAKAVALCKRSSARLLVAKLDRLARDVHPITSLLKQGVDFLAVDNPHAKQAHRAHHGGHGEHERDAISQRTKEAMAAEGGASQSAGARAGDNRASA